MKWAMTVTHTNLPQGQNAHKQDRHALQNRSLHWINDTLDPCQHPSGRLVNIITGMVMTHPSVHVHDTVQLGSTQMEIFEKTLPEGFHDTIHKSCESILQTCEARGSWHNYYPTGSKCAIPEITDDTDLLVLLLSPWWHCLICHDGLSYTND